MDNQADDVLLTCEMAAPEVPRVISNDAESVRTSTVELGSPEMKRTCNVVTDP